jgi:hypothetical protein
VKLPAEVTALLPAGYKLVFSDEFGGDQVDTKSLSKSSRPVGRL